MAYGFFLVGHCRYTMSHGFFRIHVKEYEVKGEYLKYIKTALIKI